jgi:hypothetical protein
LEERRLLSASRAAWHAAGPHKLDLSHAADVTQSDGIDTVDEVIASQGKKSKPLAAPLDDHRLSKLIGSDGHGPAIELPGKTVSDVARQLSSLDRPSDGPAAGHGWALGHLISNTSHGKPHKAGANDDASSQPLWTVSTTSTALPASAIASSSLPLSTTSKAVLDGNGASHSVTVSVAATPASQPVATSSAHASAASFSSLLASSTKAQQVTAAKPVTPPLHSAPANALAGPTAPPTHSSTSKVVVDDEGEKHDVTVKASSASAKWTINSNNSNSKPPRSVPSIPADTPKQIAVKPPTSGRPVTGPTVSRPAATPVHSAPPPSPSPMAPAPHSPTQAEVSAIAGPQAPPPVAVASADVEQPPADVRSEAAISSQEQHSATNSDEQPEAAAAAETPPSAPTHDNPAGAPSASLDAPGSSDSRQAPPLDAQAQLNDGEGIDGGQFDAASDSQSAAMAMASLWSSVSAADPGALLANACSALAETIPIDASALDEALTELLDELEDLGGDLATSLAQAGVSPWIAAAALGTAAGAAQRRYRRRLAERSLGAQAAVLRQFPELLGLVPRGDA